MLSAGRHFVADEFRCHDGTPYPEEYADRWIDLRDLCDGCRDIHGSALVVISGYRTPLYNAGLFVADQGRGAHGVVSSSQHIEGNAADLRSTAPATALYSEIIIAYEQDMILTTIDGKQRRLRDLLGGIGVYSHSNWVHVDTHKATDGHLRKWTGA